MTRKMNTEGFIEKAKKVHGDKYDYSQVEYVNSSTKVKIICPVHGEMFKAPYKHLEGRGCRQCYFDRITIGKKQFLKEASDKFGDFFDYSEMKYKGMTGKKVKIICPLHGEIMMEPYQHLRGKFGGCKGCSIDSQRMSKESFNEKCREVHGDKYDYSKVVYVSNNTKIKIICPIHGEFEQTPASHQCHGSGCPKCAAQERFLAQEEVVKQFRQTHGNKYDYSRVEYKSGREKVKIICPLHGEFFQAAANHKNGQGCPECAKYGYREKWLREVLEECTEMAFPSVFPKWLRNPNSGRLLELDCYNKKMKLAIEYQGKQHYQPVEYFGGLDAFLKYKERDRIKWNLCLQKGIILWRIDARNFNHLNESAFKDKMKSELLKFANCKHSTPDFMPQSEKIRFTFLNKQ